MFSFLKELRDRKVGKVAIVYIVGGWLLIQVADVMFPALGLPAWTVTLVVALLIIGFPIALVLAWAYESTPDGIRLDPGRAASSDRGDLDAAAEITDQPKENSIAVLPFIDLSPSRDNEYFSDGLTEELLNVLTAASDLRVSSRTSCFTFKGKDVDIPTVARKLKVSYVLEGSVRKAGNHIRITAQLIEAAGDTHLWSETYDRELENIFEIQDDIAQEIARTLRVKMDPQAAAELKAASAKAYDLYLRGRDFYHKFAPKPLKYAIEMFRRATELDPQFARAWCGIADCHSILVLYYQGGQEDLEDSETASQKAIELAPNLAAAHVSRGLHHVASKRYGEARQAFKRAIDIDGKDFEAHYHLGRAYFHENNLEDALKWLEKAAILSPDDFNGPLIAAPIYRKLGQIDKARAAEARGLENVERYLEAHPDSARAYFLGAWPLYESGEKAKAYEWAERALAIDPEDGSTLYNLACFYASTGEHDKALDCLERGGIHSLEWVAVDPDLDPIREDPRFKKVIGRLKER